MLYEVITALLAGGKEQKAVVMTRTGESREAVCLFLFAPATSVDFPALIPARNFSLVLDTGDEDFGGPGRAFAELPARRARIRITSYNVCYTKLLRASAAAVLAECGSSLGSAWTTT